MPSTELVVGGCSLLSWQEIIQANFSERREMNPSYLVIGTCSDGGFIVMDVSRSENPIGYVAIQEVGDDGPWRDHYVEISPNLGCFLYDTMFLGILPDDYYQAKDLGYCTDVH